MPNSDCRVPSRASDAGPEDSPDAECAFRPPLTAEQEREQAAADAEFDRRAAEWRKRVGW
jgi:hypothetical protein